MTDAQNAAMRRTERAKYIVSLFFGRNELAANSHKSHTVLIPVRNHSRHAALGHCELYTRIVMNCLYFFVPFSRTPRFLALLSASSHEGLSACVHVQKLRNIMVLRSL